MSETSSSSTSSPLEDIPPQELAASPTSYAAPGWMVSGILHASLLAVLMTSGLPSCSDQPMGIGTGDGDFVEVGIYVKDPMLIPSTGPLTDAAPTQDPQVAAANTPTVPEAPAAQSAAADLIELPEVAPRTIIGQSQGTRAPEGIPNVSENIVSGNSIRAPATGGEDTGPGRVAFMGKSTEAESVVFVIDTSSSMDLNNAMQYAHEKLKQSINGLKQSQQFQIIPYNTVASVMRLRNDREGALTLYRATGPNLRLATAYINSLRASGGTKHAPALEQAFRFKPDVIFFLTDADDHLTAKELSVIKSLWNKSGKTQIHCIQFGTGADLKSATSQYMRTLASENHGSYTYIDVEKLENP